jgi:hypothetical protein
MVRKIAKISLLVIFSMSCGTKDKVDTIKGEKGDKGDRGINGEDGKTIQTQAKPRPQPIPTYYPQPIPQPTYIPVPVPYPVPQPVPLPSQPCSNCVKVCACVNGVWSTISIYDTQAPLYKIRNYGACDYNSYDCFGNPAPQPGSPPRC